MHRNFSLGLSGVVLALCAAACGGDDGPQACPVFPPCITGTTWNATICACALNDELPDAADSGQGDHTTEMDGRRDAGEASLSDGGGEARDAPDEASD